MSYSDDTNQRGLASYELILTFIDPSKGTWHLRYGEHTSTEEYGTFKILRHGFG